MFTMRDKTGAAGRESPFAGQSGWQGPCRYPVPMGAPIVGHHQLKPAIDRITEGTRMRSEFQKPTLMPLQASPVQAVVGDTPIWGFVPVVLLPQQTSVAAAGFSANVSSLLRVSITCGLGDDTVPF